MSTGISLLFAIISTIVIVIGLALMIPDSISLAIYLIPTIIVGSFMYTIYNSFCGGMLYNLLSKKLKTIVVDINDTQISKISTSETAIMISIILTVQVILLYLVSVFILPMFLTSIMQTLMFTGQQSLAYTIYQFMIIISDPATIAMFIFAVFIITFVFTLLGTYIYNFIAKNGRGIVLNLNQKDKLVEIGSVDSLKLAIAFSIICCVLSLIMGIISLISGGDVINLITNVIGGFVGSFVEFYLLGIFYNFLAEKIGKVKIELIDFKIN